MNTIILMVVSGTLGYLMASFKVLFERIAEIEKHLGIGNEKCTSK